MTIADLPGSTELKNIKVVLPELTYNASSLPLYHISNQPVYIMGSIMGDFFVKLNLSSTQVYPLFRDFIPWEEISQWEVVE